MKTTKTTWCAMLTIALACATMITMGCGPVNVVVGRGGPVVGPSPTPSPHPAPALRVSHPVYGQRWHLGHNYVIRWNAASFVHRVRVYLSRNNGASWQYIGWAHAHAGAKVWHVPSSPTYLTNQARIRVVDMNHPGNRSTSRRFRIVP